MQFSRRDVIMWERRIPGAIPILDALLRRHSTNDADFVYFEGKVRREKSSYYRELRSATEDKKQPIKII